MFYVFNPADTELTHVVAEVTNTPWKERHVYVLWKGNRDPDGGPLHFRNAKWFHVSPFMGMDVDYRWRITVPNRDLMLRIENHQSDGRFFHATLVMHAGRSIVEISNEC